MQGKKNSVAGKLMRDYPHVIPVWCIAHKLQLSVMEALKATLKGIYKYYHGSPKKRRQLLQLPMFLKQIWRISKI